MDTLIIAPQLNRTGGVSNFYRMLYPYLKKKGVHFLFIGGNGSVFSKHLSRFTDIIRFLRSAKKHDLILLNPSLGSTAFVRDALYSFILTYICHKKFLVFWHGWNDAFAKHVESSKLLKYFYRKTIATAQLMFILRNDIKEHIVNWGFHGHIEKATTAFEDRLSIIEPSFKNKDKSFNYLFMSRIEPFKGARVAIQAFELVQNKHSNDNFTLTVAGDGSQLNSLKQYIETRHIKNVFFPGYVREEEKRSLLQNAHCFLFPSSHGEGLPCSVLEAMAVGLPIITSRCGAIPDLFQKDKMGIMLDDISTETVYEAMEKIYNNDHIESVSSFNKQYALEHFSASKVASFLIEVLEGVSKQQDNK